jgi:hypothetical protein
MRIARILAGMLALLFAMPVLGAGVLGWWMLKHRGPDGTFRAELAPITAVRGIVVVPDVDALLRRDAPIARADRTELRMTVEGGGFIGMASPADLAAYLAGTAYTELVRARLGLGPLAVQTRDVRAAGGALAPHEKQPFWVRGAVAQLRWSPAEDRGRHLALIVIADRGDGPVRLDVALNPGWLGSTTSGLLVLGPMLVVPGLAALASPHRRRREFVYVIDGEIVAEAELALLPRPAPPPLSEGWPPEPAPPELPMPVAGHHRHLTTRR